MKAHRISLLKPIGYVYRTGNEPLRINGPRAIAWGGMKMLGKIGIKIQEKSEIKNEK
jgi:hypothetical protein